ncbi:DgyrCDS5190 [Dimorphilus gyrociliatus]|uniref:DgyrCDS5190 n=1 Tax=Dimorphilus gyrociliatus TaxID=2664684 RepID=A0A7I8VJ28_9ANNE|nr:DgyrCDS5190 [Dimorphilus gyrociliatus]
MLPTKGAKHIISILPRRSVFNERVKLTTGPEECTTNVDKVQSFVVQMESPTEENQISESPISVQQTTIETTAVEESPQQFNRLIRIEKFPRKLFALVNLGGCSGIQWTHDGKSIVIDPYLFKSQYLDTTKNVFKTTNIKSFIRQLNLYGFKKQKSHPSKYKAHVLEFFNEYFVKGRPDLLLAVQRRRNVKVIKNELCSDSAPSGSNNQRKPTYILSNDKKINNNNDDTFNVNAFFEDISHLPANQKQLKLAKLAQDRIKLNKKVSSKTNNLTLLPAKRRYSLKSRHKPLTPVKSNLANSRKFSSEADNKIRRSKISSFKQRLDSLLKQKKEQKLPSTRHKHARNILEKKTIEESSVTDDQSELVEENRDEPPENRITYTLEKFTALKLKAASYPTEDRWTHESEPKLQCSFYLNAELETETVELESGTRHDILVTCARDRFLSCLLYTNVSGKLPYFTPGPLLKVAGCGSIPLLLTYITNCSLCWGVACLDRKQSLIYILCASSFDTALPELPDGRQKDNLPVVIQDADTTSVLLLAHLLLPKHN